jgi:hypothetical protein
VGLARLQLSGRTGLNEKEFKNILYRPICPKGTTGFGHIKAYTDAPARNKSPAATTTAT